MDLNVGGNGDQVVVLINGASCWEVLGKEGDLLEIMSHNRLTRRSAAEMEAEGFTAAAAHKVIKADGTVMYMVPLGEDSAHWYVGGKRFGGKKDAAGPRWR